MESLEQYLKATKLCECDSPKIRRLAKRIIGKKKGIAAARALFYWVREKIEWQIVPVVGAKRVLSRKPLRAECADKNNVMVALARAVGIPARYVLIMGRLKVKKKELDAVIPHVGCEVYIDGRWILADPSYGKNTRSIIEMCKWGKPVWKSAKSVQKLVELPYPMFPREINKALKVHPIALKYKKLLSHKRTAT